MGISVRTYVGSSKSSHRAVMKAVQDMNEAERSMFIALCKSTILVKTLIDDIKDGVYNCIPCG